MRDFAPYMIVGGDTMSRLSDDVRMYAREGWQPVGSVFVDKEGRSYHQPMFLPVIKTPPAQKPRKLRRFWDWLLYLPSD